MQAGGTRGPKQTAPHTAPLWLRPHKRRRSRRPGKASAHAPSTTALTAASCLSSSGSPGERTQNGASTRTYGREPDSVDRFHLMLSAYSSDCVVSVPHRSVVAALLVSVSHTCFPRRLRACSSCGTLFGQLGMSSVAALKLPSRSISPSYSRCCNMLVTSRHLSRRTCHKSPDFA